MSQERFLVRQPLPPATHPQLHTVLRDPDGVVTQVLVEAVDPELLPKLLAVLDGRPDPGPR